MAVALVVGVGVVVEGGKAGGGRGRGHGGEGGRDNGGQGGCKSGSSGVLIFE